MVGIGTDFCLNSLATAAELEDCFDANVFLYLQHNFFHDLVAAQSFLVLLRHGLPLHASSTVEYLVVAADYA